MSEATSGRRAVAKALGVLACALVAWGAWYGEILYRFGWAGTKWLDGPVSPFLICPLVALGVILALAPPARLAARLGFIFMAALVFLACYGVAGEEIEELHSRAIPSAWTLVRLVGGIVVGWLFAPTALLLCTVMFLEPIRARVVPYAALALVLVVPLSLASVALYSHGAEHDYIHAVKMGYPVFWTALLVPAAAALAGRPAGIGDP